MEYTRVNWENGEKIADGYVIIDGETYNTVDPEYSGNTPINASNLNIMDEAIYNLSKPIEYIELVLSEDKNFGSGSNYYYLDNLDVINYQIGSKFKTGSKTPSASATSMAGVKIPAGINRVNVSGQMTISNNNETSAMMFVSFIYKISPDGTVTTISRSQKPNILAGSYVTNTMAPKTIDVQEEDIIGFGIYKSLSSGTCTARGVSEQTFLTVEEVRG